MSSDSLYGISLLVTIFVGLVGLFVVGLRGFRSLKVINKIIAVLGMIFVFALVYYRRDNLTASAYIVIGSILIVIGALYLKKVWRAERYGFITGYSKIFKKHIPVNKTDSPYFFRFLEVFYFIVGLFLVGISSYAIIAGSFFINNQ